MNEKNNIAPNVDVYIAGFPARIGKKLTEMRQIIHSAVPDLGEKISWRMPAFTLKGKTLVQFAAHKTHIGFYPMPETIEAFHDKITGYATGKGSIQFPYDKQLPEKLIIEMVRFRESQVADKSAK